MCWDIVEEERQRVVGAGHVTARTSVDGGRDEAVLEMEKRQGGLQIRGCDSSSCLYCQECEENSYCRWGERWCVPEESGSMDQSATPVAIGEASRCCHGHGRAVVGDECREIGTLPWLVCDGDGGFPCSSSNNNDIAYENNYNGVGGEREGSTRSLKTRREEIVCGLEFGARGRLLASAGTSKQVKLYSVVDGMNCRSDTIHDSAMYNNKKKKNEYYSDHDEGKLDCYGEEIGACVQVHRLPSKLSSIAWNPGRAGLVTVGDYDGNVTSLDVESGHVVSEEDGHCGRRVWSVSYSGLGARETCLASASDDGTVALWDARNMVVASRMAPSRNAMPVTGVQFCPWDDNLVAVSATDAKGYLYDIRNTEMPLFVFHGHCRPLSYARFLSRDTIVSAAIDSKIMAWNFKTGEIEATYTGHCNNKHFVGLSVGPKNVVACGSEDTRVYCYRRECPENPICYTPARYLSQGHGEVFCSAVAWQSVADAGDCHVLASAFSDGSISMLGYKVIL